MNTQLLPYGAALVAWSLISYLYHPTVTLMIAGALIGVALSALIFWSSSKIPTGKWWALKILAVSTVAGLMNSTALDVAYSLFSAPEGNRFVLPIEMVVTGLVLTGLAVLNIAPWSKK